MELFLNDNVILVAGNAGPFCSDLIAALAREAAIPVWIGNQETEINGAITDLKLPGGEPAFTINTNLADPTNCKNALEKILVKFGRIDGLINCREIIDNPANPENDTQGNFHASLHKSLLGYFLVVSEALPALKQSSGPIINIVADSSGTVLQNAINGGYNALTREWAVELLPHGIRVNTVCLPANVDSAREGSINMVLFLLSKRSSHTTGQVVFAGHQG